MAALTPRPRYGAIASTTTGARFDARLPFETWREIGTKLGTYANASAWWLGDWLLFGRTKYGRRYKDAIAATGLDYQTLRNYAVVARRFHASRRRADVSFQHHAEVCAMTDAEQDRWLELAAAGGWSRNELRRRIRAGRAPDATPRVVRVAVAGERHAVWREAAGRCDRALEEWVVWALDEAARRTLERGRAIRGLPGGSPAGMSRRRDVSRRPRVRGDAPGPLPAT